MKGGGNGHHPFTRIGLQGRDGGRGPLTGIEHGMWTTHNSGTA